MTPRTLIHQPDRTPLSAAPTRRHLGTYEAYAEAARAVDMLSDAGFPVDRVAIVGGDLRVVERVPGHLATGWAVGLAALVGAWWGLFSGLLLGVFTPTFLAPVLVGLVLGALFGAGTGAVGHAVLRVRRDTSTGSPEAGHYELLFDEGAAPGTGPLRRP